MKNNIIHVDTSTIDILSIFVDLLEKDPNFRFKINKDPYVELVETSKKEQLSPITFNRNEASYSLIIDYFKPSIGLYLISSDIDLFIGEVLPNKYVKNIIVKDHLKEIIDIIKTDRLNTNFINLVKDLTLFYHDKKLMLSYGEIRKLLIFNCTYSKDIKYDDSLIRYFTQLNKYNSIFQRTWKLKSVTLIIDKFRGYVLIGDLKRISFCDENINERINPFKNIISFLISKDPDYEIILNDIRSELIKFIDKEL